MLHKRTKERVYFDFFHVASLRGWSTATIAKKLEVTTRTVRNIKERKYKETKTHIVAKMALHIYDQKARGFY